MDIGDGSDQANPIIPGKAGEHRSMAERSCEACSRKKTRCDRQLPMCGLCNRTKTECHFPTGRKRPSKPDPALKAKMRKIDGNIDRLVELLESNSGNVNTVDQSGSMQINNETRTSAASDRNGAEHGLLTPTNSHGFVASPNVGEDIASVPPGSSTIPRGLAFRLLDVYFDKIQPWLGILHQPNFLREADSTLCSGEDSLVNVSGHEVMLYNCIFALAARFLNIDGSDTKPRDRGEPFFKKALALFKEYQDTEEPSLSLLQAFIMLAVYHYSSGRTSQGWVVTHVCIRASIDLGLHEVDDAGPDSTASEDHDWVQKEQMRRLFWAVWELDTFSSVTRRKPNAINWRFMHVKLPVSDHAWFSGREIQSAEFIPGSNVWKSLNDTSNCDERAWTLLAKGLLSHVADRTMFKHSLTHDQRSTLENNISCYKLAMPETMQVHNPSWSAADISPATRTFGISAHIYLAACSFLVAHFQLKDPNIPEQDEIPLDQTKHYHDRVVEFSAVARKWPLRCIHYTQPYLACAILSLDESLIKRTNHSELVTSYRDLSELILKKFAEIWTLGAMLLRIRELSRNFVVGDEATRAELVKQYPIYFDTSIRKGLRRSLMLTQGKDQHSNSASPANNSVTSPISVEQMPALSLSYEDPYTAPDFFAGYPVDVNDPNNMDDFTSYPNLNNGSPDLDNMFNGLLKEPLWQDFNAFNFLA